MKKLDFTVQILTISVSVSLISIAASYAGGKVGNGGDSCVAEFKAIAMKLGDAVRSSPSLASQLGVKKDLFLAKTKPLATVIHVVPDNQSLLDPKTGLEVEATNDEDSKIIFKRAWCERPEDEKKVALVFHEYLGLVGLEQSQDYSISGVLFSLTRLGLQAFFLHIETQVFESAQTADGSCNWWNGREKDMVDLAQKTAKRRCVEAGYDICVLDNSLMTLKKEAPCTATAVTVGYKSSDPFYRAEFQDVGRFDEAIKYKTLTVSNFLDQCRQKGNDQGAKSAEACRQLGGWNCDARFTAQYESSQWGSYTNVDCRINSWAKGLFIVRR